MYCLSIYITSSFAGKEGKYSPHQSGEIKNGKPIHFRIAFKAVKNLILTRVSIQAFCRVNVEKWLRNGYKPVLNG
jgi:hypothetical protein